MGSSGFAPVKPSVPVDVFQQLDIRVGTIVSVDDVPKSKRVVRLRVDLGSHERTILAGLRQERSKMSDLVGKQTLLIVNIEPKRIIGELSEGMLLDLGFADGIAPVLAVPQTPVPNGTRAG